MHVYMAVYGHLYPSMHHFGPREVHKTFFQCIYSQEAGAHYNKLIQLQFAAQQTANAVVRHWKM